MKPIIEVKKIVNKFGDNLIHDELDFNIFPKEVVAIVGGNGTGKSVLMRSIVGLRKINSGRIMVGGKDISKLNKSELLDIQKLWSVLFQKGALFSNLTVVENIAFQLKEKTNLSEKIIESLSRMRVDMVGLPYNAGDKYPSELSGGMIKRAALARSLVLDPKILFLDEPTAGLDAVAAEEFDSLIRNIVDETGISVCMITHDLDSLKSICDRIAVLVDKKIRSGTLQDHLKDRHPWVKEYFHNKRTRFLAKG